MELVPIEEVDEDSTLSWTQLAGCGLCCLLCCGVGMATRRCGQMAMARCFTRGQEVAPKMKAMQKEMAEIPALVRDQGCQTEEGTFFCSSPRTEPSGTPTKAGLLDTPRRGQQKDILLDMARRAQPVIREIEARKHWSVMNAASSAQEEMC